MEQLANGSMKAVGPSELPKKELHKSLRQSTKSLNKTEADFQRHLNIFLRPRAEIHAQAVTLLLANGLRYTPDFVSFGEALESWEVKGATKGRMFARDDAIAKLTIAARVYPQIKFYLAFKDRNASGLWHIEEVLA